MATKDCHIGSNRNVGFEFPCPECPKKGMASGNFDKIKERKMNKDGIIPIVANCNQCEKSFEGTAILDDTDINVTVTFDDAQNDSDLNVWGY